MSAAHTGAGGCAVANAGAGFGLGVGEPSGPIESDNAIYFVEPTTKILADSAAFFVGGRLGKRRLASNVSPGKSLEGVAGGLAAVTTLAIAVALLADLRQPLGFVILSLVTALVSILGDLTESVFKRRAGLKDSGSIVPGHGGILDRVDSLTAAAPIFVLGGLWQGSVL